MLDELRNLYLDRHEMDRLIALSAFGRSLLTEYAAHEMEPPGWLEENLEALSLEIGRRRKDELRRQLKESRLRMEGLKTVDEKRADLAARIERLEAQLE